MLTTTNLALQKPEPLINNVDIGVINSNMDTIDTAMGNTALFETAKGTATAITLTGITLSAGRAKTFIAAYNNSGAATTINGKSLYKPGTTIAPKLIIGKAYTIWYDATGGCFFIKASAEGDAIAGNVLAGKIFSNDDDTGLAGTMPNNGPSVAETINLTTGGAEYTIPAGHHSGLRKIKAVITNLIASVIKAGTTVGGVLGTFTADATALASHILAGKSAYVNGTKLTGSMNEYSESTLFLAGHGESMTVNVDVNDNRMGIVVVPNAPGHDGHISGSTKFYAQLWGLIPQAIAAGQVVGQYPGYGTGYMTGTFSADATIEPHLMIEGYSAYKNGAKVIGTMPGRGSEEYHGWRRADRYVAPSPGRVHLRIPLGAYLVGAGEQQGLLGVFSDDPAFVPANILNTANIFGMQGTAVAGKRYASGGPVLTGGHQAFDYGDRSYGSPAVYMDTITVSGLTFKPSMIVVRLSQPSQNFLYTTVYTKNPAVPGMQTILAYSFDYYGAGGSSDIYKKWYQIYDNDHPYAWAGGDRVAYVNTSGFRLPVPATGSRYNCTWEAYE